MAHPRKALVPLLTIVLSLLSPPLLPAQTSSAPGALKDGIDLFRDGQYEKAIQRLNDILSNPSADPDKPAAYLLVAKSYMAIGKLDEASKNLELYLANYPGAADFTEALYQKGRLLFLQEDYENALQALQSFLAAYPKSSFVSSAWFWAAESLYALGHLDDASALYRKIITDFPTSVKVEAAQYKISLIQLQKKMVELQKLLAWSNEESLRASEDFQNREKAYQQAIRTYQKQSTDAAAAARTIAGLQQDLAAMTEEAKKHETEAGVAEAAASEASAREAAALAASAREAAAAASAASAVQAQADQLARLQRLLAAKQAALALKEQYLALLQPDAATGGTGK